MTHGSPLPGRLVLAHPPPPSLHSLASARAHLPLCLTSQCDTLSQGQSTGAPQPNEPALASTSGLPEVLKIRMVRPDLNCLFRSDEVCLPLTKCPNHSQELLVIHIVVLFSCCQGVGDVVHHSPGPIYLLL